MTTEEFIDEMSEVDRKETPIWEGWFANRLRKVHPIYDTRPLWQMVRFIISDERERAVRKRDREWARVLGRVKSTEAQRIITYMTGE